MIYVLLLLVLVGLIAGPGLWVRWIMKRYSEPRPDFPGTGGQFAEHLLKRFELTGVTVEPTDAGDHYDPGDKCVRLSSDNYQGKSLTAVVIAAHEVGHAIQDGYGYAPLQWRGKLAVVAQTAQRAGSVVMFAVPMIGGLARSPLAMAGTYGLAAGIMLLGVLVHLVTLPVELDASFRRALPALQAGGYLADHDMPKARRLLTAAAMTYVAQSLFSLFNVWQWIRLLRR